MLVAGGYPSPLVRCQDCAGALPRLGVGASGRDGAVAKTDAPVFCCRYFFRLFFIPMF